MKSLIPLIIGFGLVLSSLADSTSEPAKPPPITKHTYKVDPETFVSHLKHLLPPLPGESTEKLLLRFIKQQNVEFPTYSSRGYDNEGKLVVMTRVSSVAWNQENGTLVVMTTKQAQENIRALVEKILNEKRP